MIKIWLREPGADSTADFKVIHTIATDHTLSILSVEFLNEKELITGSDDGTVKVWSKDGSKWGLKQTLRKHQGSVCVVRKTPHEQFVSGGFDMKLVV